MALRWTMMVMGLMVSGLCLGAATATRAPAQEPPVPEVFIVPIQGEIGPRTVALAQRALREAESLGARGVILDIDTPGGRLDAMFQASGLVQSIMDRGVPTIAFVRGEAVSAGAYLALVSKEIYMAPGSKIGAIVPVILGPGGTTQIPDDDARLKEYAYLRKSVRAQMEQRGGYGQRALRLAEGMTDPTMSLFDVSYADPDGFAQSHTHTASEIAELRAQGIDVTTNTEHSRPVVLTADEAIEFGVVQGAAASLELLVRDRFDVPMSATTTVELSWSEEAAGWISSFKFLLLLGGFVLLMIELKTPGVFVPGVLGVILIALALFGGYLTGLAQWSDILLMVVGTGLIAVELFLVPGLLLPGLAGFFCVLLGLILSQQPFNWPSTPMEEAYMASNLQELALMFGLLIVCSILLWKFLPRIPFFSRVLQAPTADDPTGVATQLGRASGAARLGALMGRVGVATTDLRPAGIVTVGSDRLDVVSDDGWLDAGTEVVIREIHGNRIVVGVPSPQDPREEGHNP